MSERQSNDRKIENAFGRFQRNVSQALEDGLVRMCESAVETALSLHIATDEHLNTRDGYGYALFHSGALLASRTYIEGGTYKGKVEDYIASYVPSSDGYDAVIVADMSLPMLGSTYSFVKERDILTTTAQDVANDFGSYFKPVGR